MLLIACSAVLAGARSFAAIGQWGPQRLTGHARPPRRPHDDRIQRPDRAEHARPPKRPERRAPAQSPTCSAPTRPERTPWPFTARAPAAHAPPPTRPPICWPR
ncbi:hypothetical protein ACFYZ8_26200 [Streptomyces sp. NPDC001668]|uniref:hypothetical protein n=1 Tax=Streptomyces sp. NPDC001668 TaxID=3364598 RepID=UPI00369EB498